MNNLIVITKLAIVLLVIAIGWRFINPVNHTPYIPAPTTYATPQGITHPYGGIMGILGAAGMVFFAFIGFDAVSTPPPAVGRRGRVLTPRGMSSCGTSRPQPGRVS